MTQDIITGIKQEEDPKEEETSSIDYMSAVAQSCLDNIPNVTWKIVTLALIDAKELVLIRQVIMNLTECSCLQGKKNLFLLISVSVLYRPRRKYKKLLDSSKNHETTLCSVKRSDRKLVTKFR